MAGWNDPAGSCVRESDFKVKRFSLLLLGCPALFAAGHNVLLPQPQKVHYGEGRLPLSGLSVVSATAAAPEDAFAVKLLSEGLVRRGGRAGGHTLRLTRTGAIDTLPRDNEQPGPDSRESYHLRITPAG